MGYRRLLPFYSGVLFFLLATALWGQGFRGQIRGLITDATNTPMAGATVTLTGVNTGVATRKVTDNVGLYVFDLIDPGSYTITVEATGFSRYVQQNITLEAGAIVTVNATLNPGELQQSVTVDATPPVVDFTSSDKQLTIDTKLVAETPRLDRNPFKLTLLEPAAVNTRGEMQPFNSWGANSVDLGGQTNLKNNLLVDGNPIGIGHKAGYPPNQDGVQESIVSQNSVDAASGHSAGGAISLATKSGTNQWHGSAFYLGRYPWLSAEADRTRFVQNATRQHMGGGTFGNPIIRNKLFNFFSYEKWHINSPGSYTRTVPTSAERGGDFSHTLAADGTLRTIYNPFTQPVNDPASGGLVRAPFPNNVIPSSLFDPVTAKLAPQFPDANNPGIGYNHANNYIKSLVQTTDYYNLSDRVDYNINDKVRVSGFYGRYYSTDSQTNPISSSSPLYQPAGSLRIANQVLGDATWSISPTLVANFHGSWFNLVDAYVSTGLGPNGWSQVWPNNWYAPYLAGASNVPVYYPNLNIGGNSFGGPGFFWDQRPAAESASAQLLQTKGSHYLKYGFEYRRGAGPVFVSNTNNFYFNQSLTTKTISSPNLNLSGDPFATFLLGALDNSTQLIGGPAPVPITNFYGAYIGDDWKITRNLTLTLGLREEYESAWHDTNHYLSRNLDLTATDPAIAANPPQMPAAATNIVGSNFYSFAGQWNFTNEVNPGMWFAPKLNLQPRFGAAYRLGKNTALRFGYALYTIPTEYNFTAAPVSGFEDVNFLEPPFFGLTTYQNVAPPQNGVPQATFANPFPASNPLVPFTGKSSGTNVGRGGSPLLWYPQSFRKAYNNRLNFTVERELPGKITASVSYFMNFGNQHYNVALNNINPQYLQQYSPSYLSTAVANPFYHYLNPTIIPGSLYNQPTVPLSTLLVKYPLYGPLYEIGVRGASEFYRDLEIKLQKRFSQGYNFLFGYIYIRERSQINNFNDQTLYSNTLQWQDSNAPHHRIVTAGTYELPFGNNKMFLANIPRAANAVIGGWQITGNLTFISGSYPQFGNLIVTSDPCQNVPAGYYFNPKAFSPLPANVYTLRTNPLQYSCITGPSFFNIDATLQKNIHFTERIQGQLKLTAYNATNKLNRGSPDTNQADAAFGQSLYQGSPGGTYGAQAAVYGNQAGRQIELGFKIVF
jgi:hypothetical protein